MSDQIISPATLPMMVELYGYRLKHKRLAVYVTVMTACIWSALIVTWGCDLYVSGFSWINGFLFLTAPFVSFSYWRSVPRRFRGFKATRQALRSLKRLHDMAASGIVLDTHNAAVCSAIEQLEASSTQDGRILVVKHFH